ncbi:MAG: tetratricopeptide repeat protein [candidate division WOR-3 bacterium]|nr:MAG: tetratricopeptide repeat protein [candidate division WOR-3 bacterium]
MKKSRTPRSEAIKRNPTKMKIDALLESADKIRASDPKQAIALAKRSLTLAKKSKYKKGIATSYETMCSAHRIASEYSQAKEYCKMAIEIYKEIGDENGRANCLLNNGIINTEIGDYKNAMANYVEALKMLENIGDKVGCAQALLDMGVMSSRQHDLKQGTEYFLQALKYFESMHSYRNIAATYLNVGANYYETGYHEKALRYFLRSLRIFKKINDKKGYALSHQNIGEFHFRQGNSNKALRYLTKAIEIFNTIGDKYGIARTHLALGNIYMKSRKYTEALISFENSLQYAKEKRAKDVQIEAYENLATLYEKQRDHMRALRNYKKYQKLTQEVFNATKSKQIEALRTRYETEKKEREAEVSQLKNVKLRNEIKRRKLVEKELKKHRDHLERLVEERTADLRSLAHELSLVEERQRRKIATYLHDDISQALALAALKLQSVREENSIPKIGKALEDVEEIIEHTNERTRSLTFEISPPILYDMGLEPALEWLTGQFSKKHSIECAFSCDQQPKPMHNDTSVLLFQSVRELLTNAAKHARASKINVSVFKKDNVMRIEVTDNGIGFDPDMLKQKTTRNEGFGLFNLKERLRHMRGKLEISSKVGQGSSVALIAPLEVSSPVT